MSESGKLTMMVLGAIGLAGCAAVTPAPAADDSAGPQLIEVTTACPRVGKNVTFDRPDGAYRIRLGKTGATFGKWSLLYRLPDSLTGCAFGVEHDAPNLAAANLLPVRVTWLDAERKELQSSYLVPSGKTAFSRSLHRPPGAQFVTLDCGLRYAPEQAVSYRNVKCERAEIPDRPVRLVVVKSTPKDDKKATCEDNQLRMEKVFRQLEADGEKPDLVVFPETFLTRWVPDVGETKGAQPIPGPHTEWAAGWARKLHTNVVVSLREKDGDRYFVSAAVIDRQGKLVGRYRKTQFTVGEYEGGYDWGTELPVFDLDFGRIGVLICWDLWFPEAARTLRVKGAEIIAYPIASTNPTFYDVMWRSRAVENGLYLAAAISGPGGRCPARVVGPDGQVLAETWNEQTYAATTIDLGKPFFIPYLSVSCDGENGNFYMGERHPALYHELGVPREVCNESKQAEQTR